jgi:DNA-binding transcriptional regulator YhcF (GntR family)
MKTIVHVPAEVFYFNCTQCGAELLTAEQRESGWCGCETKAERKSRLLSRGKPFSTKREYVLTTLRKFFEENKQAPTLRQMASLFGVSPDAAREYLRHLEDAGDVIRTRRTARGFVLKGCEHLIEVKAKEQKPREPYKRIMSKETLEARIERVVAEARRREAEGVQVLGQSDVYAPMSRTLTSLGRSASKIG